MDVNVLLTLFTLTLTCSAAPTSETERCGKLEQMEGAALQGNWDAETYSPGTVATFTCLNGNIRDGAIKMACIEGEWIDISKGQCRVSGNCSKPKQSHENGELEGRWEDDTIPPGTVATYNCPQGYRQTSPIKLACTEGEWISISKGQCTKEIVCYKDSVSNGIVDFGKETYREGETVTLTCNEGFKIEHNPEEPRRCTANGWFPPLKCSSKTCDEPKIINGYISNRWYYSFPLTPGRSLDFQCNSGYLTKTKAEYDTITCTENGWDGETKCFRKCFPPSQDAINAYILYTSHHYIEGDTLQYECYKGYTTSDGEDSGEVTCLLDGSFTGERCDKL